MGPKNFCCTNDDSLYSGCVEGAAKLNFFHCQTVRSHAQHAVTVTIPHSLFPPSTEQTEKEKILPFYSLLFFWGSNKRRESDFYPILKERLGDLRGKVSEGRIIGIIYQQREMGTLQTWRKAYGALKDQTKVGLAHVNSDFKVPF